MNATPWGRSQASIVGQLVEWEVWVELVVQSHGRLHVFLPLLDRGMDAPNVLRDIDDQAQVLGRDRDQLAVSAPP